MRYAAREVGMALVLGVAVCVGLGAMERPARAEDTPPATVPPAADPATVPPATVPPAADPAPDDGGGWLDLGPPLSLPSALDTLHTDVIAEPGAPDLAAVLPKGLGALVSMRSRWFFRPRLSADAVVGGPIAPRLGAVVGQQWWMFADAKVRPAGETALLGDVELSRAGGDFRLYSVGGLWWGPLGFFLGPDARWDHVVWAGGADSDLAVGPVARLIVDAGVVHPWSEVGVGWSVMGGRPALASEPWDSRALGAGLVVGEQLQLRLEGRTLQTGSGDRWEAIAGLHIRLG